MIKVLVSTKHISNHDDYDGHHDDGKDEDYKNHYDVCNDDAEKCSH